MLEAGVEALKKKYSSESAKVSEELTTLKKQMDVFINHQEEELDRQREMYEILMEKNKMFVQDLMQFAQKSEETQVKLTEMEERGRSQAKVIENLKLKLAAKEEKEETATKVKEEPGCQSARTQEPTQSIYPPILPLSSTDDEELVVFSSDSEDDTDSELAMVED